MLEQDRLISADSQGEDAVIERAIRPRLLEEYVGQAVVKRPVDLEKIPRIGSVQTLIETFKGCQGLNVHSSILKSKGIQVFIW